MEKKCPHHPNSVLCRHRRKEPVGGEADRGVGRLDRHAGKVGQMKIVVIPTTGGQLEVCVSPTETVRGLKQVLARKYRIAPARIHLLHKERVLKDGNLQDNQVTPGSRLVLCPNMESGTSPSRAEHSVIQALKNLSQAQIHDFLSGRAPLTLAIRLGEHLMFVQLQLSTASPTSPPRSLTPPSTPTTTTAVPSSSPPPPPPPAVVVPTPLPPQPSSISTPIPVLPPRGLAPPPPPSHPHPHPPHPYHRHHPHPPQVSGNVRPPVLVPPPPAVDPASLLQASQNLTEKLKELTHLTQQALQARAQRTPPVPSMPVPMPSMPLTPPPSPPPSPGAVIDSMQHVGRGVYSGTFSGTLDPRLQDGSGQPRRDVNTILHILHDLLLARPSSHLTPPPTPSSSSSSSSTRTRTPSSSTYIPHHPYTQLPPSPRSPTLGAGENAAMRAKVMRVQRMLEQRRMRRLARRLSQRPYPPTSSSSSPLSAAAAMHHCHLSEPTSFPFPPTSDPSANAAGHGENVDTANYRKPSMEQETVAV